MNIITIDGPAGVGKSSIAKILAEKLGYAYLNTGVFYRAYTFVYLTKKCTSIEELLQLNLIFQFNGKEIQAFLDQNLITYDQIRSSEVEANIAIISTNETIRLKVVQIERDLAQKYRLIVEGREQGTFVFPEAKYKFYLDASIKTRAERRLKDLNKNISIKELEERIEKRDYDDSKREYAPLRIPENAIIIKTDNLTIEQLTEKMLAYLS